MPRMRRIRLLVVIGIGWCSAELTAAPGCPFCPPTQPTFSERLSQSDVAGLAKWVSATQTKNKDDEVGEAKTNLEVVDVIRTDNEKQFAPKSKVTLDFLREGTPGDLFVLFGKREDGKVGWSAPVEVTEVSYQYIRQAPAYEKPAQERLRFFLKCLELNDQTIANDAFAEFSRARYEDVAAIADQLPREKLRRWLESPETTQIRRGFYGLLLGLCGDESDAAFLEAQIFAPVEPDSARLGIDGMMGGYLLLRGEQGLKRLVEGKLQVADTAATDLFALLNALRFAGEYGRDRIPLADLQGAMRQFLDRVEFAEIVLPDLARWKDWGVLDRLIANYGHEPFETDSGKLKIIQFAQACAKDSRTDGGTPQRVAAAKQFLSKIEQESPDLIRQTRRSAPLKK